MPTVIVVMTLGCLKSFTIHVLRFSSEDLRAVGENKRLISIGKLSPGRGLLFLVK